MRNSHYITLSIFRTTHFRNKCLAGLSLFVFLLATTAYVPPFRNLVLRPFIQPAWRDVSTSDLIRMRFMNSGHKAVNPDDGAFKCRSKIPFKKILASCERQPKIETLAEVNNVSQIQIEMMLSRGLGRYIPGMSANQKLISLHMYMVVAKALETHKVPFFITAGSLLGIIRHGGFIPWDDDLDLGIYFKYQNATRRALTCIEDMRIIVVHPFHWQLQTQTNFPFIDLMFYDTDDRYVWALPPYIANTFIYLNENVFPLTTAEFEESISVPVPARSFNVVHRIFGFEECKVNHPHHDVQRLMSSKYPLGYSVQNVPCRELREFFHMNHLGE